MAKRKPVSATARWQVFARDDFTCRYCGAQAGEEDVSLQVDHLVSVADGGGNTMDNLVTACQRCNGGKGARSMKGAPVDKTSDRGRERLQRVRKQAKMVRASIKAKREAEQAAVNLKCEAYDLQQIRMAPGEAARILTLCEEHGADLVQKWYAIAYSYGISETRSLRYVHGIIRRIRKDAEPGA